MVVAAINAMMVRVTSQQGSRAHLVDVELLRRASVPPQVLEDRLSSGSMMLASRKATSPLVSQQSTRIPWPLPWDKQFNRGVKMVLNTFPGTPLHRLPSPP